MDKAAHIWAEEERLAVLYRYSVLDTPPETALDALTCTAATILNMPMAALSLLDRDRQWFKSEYGLGYRETLTPDSFCRQAILQSESLIIRDTLSDPFFANHPFVAGESGVRFYAGVRLVTPEGCPLGTLCVLDRKPHPDGLTKQQQTFLHMLANQVMAHFELQRVAADRAKLLERHYVIEAELRAERDQSQRLLEGMNEGFVFVDSNWRVQQINAGALALETRPASAILGRTIWEAWPHTRLAPITDALLEAVQDQTPVNLEHQISLEDGGDMWLEVRAYPANEGLVVFYRNITKRKQAESALYESRTLFHNIVAQAATGVVQADADGALTLVNPKFCAMLGYTEAELLGRNVIDITAEHSRAPTLKAVSRLAAGGADFVIEKQYQRKDGSLIWARSSVNAMRSAMGSYQGLVAIVIDITDLKEAQEKLRRASLHDPLTGLANRAMLFEYAGHLLPQKRRLHQKHAALLFLDLDRFKPINDTHGHETGDRVLKTIASRLAAILRSEDLVVRLGGDEFVVLLHDIKDATVAKDAARRIIEVINEPHPIGDLLLSVSTSIGIAVFPEDGQDIDTLISHADTAMYRAKQMGRNNFQFYCAEFGHRAAQQFAIERELRSALNSRNFYLCYQPVFDIATNQIVSAEALLRWHDADTGPDRFIPVAEASGLINVIGRWVLGEASRQHMAWQKAGLPAIPIAVNVSVVEFRDPDFCLRFTTMIEDQGINPAAIQIEVTETAVMDNIDHSVTVLSRLRDLGIKILLDDFGTGHSCFAYLARLPLDKVKIDRSFVTHLDSEQSSRAVFSAMIALGRSMSLDVVAEGVESEAVLQYLRGEGCWHAQGYHLATPMSGETFITWYAGMRLDSH